MVDSTRESITTKTESSSHVKQKKIYGKMFWLFMVDSTRESITTQTVSSSLVNKTNSMQKLTCYGRLHTRVNYDSNCVVKPCETVKKLC